MQWWNNFVRWLTSDAGWRVVTEAAIPFLAILTAGLVAALIARNTMKRVLARHDREQKTAAIGALIDAARQAAVWDSLTPQEQLLSDRAAGEADVRVRLLPLRGAGVAADWAAHEILEFKRGSATFGFQFDTLLVEFRNRLIDWQRHPARARKIFASDIARWDVELTDAEKQARAEQDAWTAEQHSSRFSAAGSDAARASAQADRPAQTGTARPVSAGFASTADGPSYLPADAGSPGSGGTGPMRGGVLPHAASGSREVEAPDDFAMPGSRRPGAPDN
ncbi:hypothetical protein [Planctomonas psychrotolerans]|uniref:hypothetical protein n=1 Tax=Planctomonas psychrotolerans TaxID=2528712 RepID=UPI001D0D184E|nr:hypothetical protein [Planctomonas psychrotolerans]